MEKIRMIGLLKSLVSIKGVTFTCEGALQYTFGSLGQPYLTSPLTPHAKLFTQQNLHLSLYLTAKQTQ